MTAAALALVALAATSPADRFRQANEAARSGDVPKAVAGYSELASAGAKSASLYWNWAQVSAARGATGEALWALLRARELEPGDAAVAREIGRLREAANLTRPRSPRGQPPRRRVVPVLEDAGPFLRLEDSSGARDWARSEDVRRLDRAPAPSAGS